MPNASSSDRYQSDSVKPTLPSSGTVSGGNYDDPAKARLREQRAKLAAEEQLQREAEDERMKADQDQRKARDQELEQKRMESQLWEMNRAEADQAAEEFQREEDTSVSVRD